MPMTEPIDRIPATRINPDPKKIRVDAIHVFCEYRKGRGVVVSAYMAETGTYGAMLNITLGESIVIEPMTRLNRKRLEILQSAARNDLQLRMGSVHEMIQAMCVKNGLTMTANVVA